jgi:type I restriction enzyme S subunit
MNYLIDVQTGIGVPHISGQQILDFAFSRPSLKTQQTIVRKLDALSAETKRLEVIYQQKINDLEELKKSVLQKAFRGELRSPEGAEYSNDGHRPSLRMGKNIPQSPERA